MPTALSSPILSCGGRERETKTRQLQDVANDHKLETITWSFTIKLDGCNFVIRKLYIVTPSYHSNTNFSTTIKINNTLINNRIRFERINRFPDFQLRLPVTACINASAKVWKTECV